MKKFALKVFKSHVRILVDVLYIKHDPNFDISFNRRMSDLTCTFRPANSHGSAVTFTIFCHFSRSHDKAPNLTGFRKKEFLK